jgi:hypothetical protein
MAQHLGIIITDEWLARQDALAANRKRKEELVEARESFDKQLQEAWCEFATLCRKYGKGTRALVNHIELGEVCRLQIPNPSQFLSAEHIQNSLMAWEINEMDRQYYELKYEGKYTM